MNAFDFSFNLLKNDVRCPLCNEEGDGNWWIDHYPECAQRHIEENSPNVDFVENREKMRIQSLFDRLADMGVPMDDLQGGLDEQPDIIPEYSGFEGITPEQSEALMDAQERAMVSAMERDGRIGYHPDPQVRMENTTWRVSAWIDNEQGLNNWVKEIVEQGLMNGDEPWQIARELAEQLPPALDDGSVGEELRDNERTWNDVNWEEIAQQHIETFKENWYHGHYERIHDEFGDDHEGWTWDDIDDYWDWTPAHLADADVDEHFRRINSGIASNVNNDMRRYLRNQEVEEEWGPQGAQGNFEQAWAEVHRNMENPEFREELGIPHWGWDAYLRDRGRRG